jgi:hypothetical protein
MKMLKRLSLLLLVGVLLDGGLELVVGPLSSGGLSFVSSPRGSRASMHTGKRCRGGAALLTEIITRLL